MDIPDIQQMADKLSRLRHQESEVKNIIDSQRARFEETIQPEKEKLMMLDQEIGKLKGMILNGLKSQNVKSIETTDAKITIVNRITGHKVVDQDKVLAYLDSRHLRDEYAEQVIQFKPHFKALCKEVDLPGVEANISETVMVTPKKEKIEPTKLVIPGRE